MQSCVQVLLTFLIIVTLFATIIAGDLNKCKPNPCSNGGICVQQTSAKAGYKCQCFGIGYYGDNCRTKCPMAEEVDDYLKPGSKPFPVECIIV